MCNYFTIYYSNWENENFAIVLTKFKIPKLWNKQKDCTAVVTIP